MVVYRASRMLLSGHNVMEKSRVSSYNSMLKNSLIFGVDKGLYAMLPVAPRSMVCCNGYISGQRVVDKLVRIVEKELNSIGAMKVSLPLLGSKELWMTAGRWEKMGSEMFQARDRNEKEYCLQPTAEEMITKIVASIGSRQRSSFPVMLYQTGNKFRDEMRPRFGLIRSREFLMNDLYTFDLSEEDGVKTYHLVSEVYCRIFRDVLGLETYVVRADNGPIGGSVSHEYHLPHEFGEDRILYCHRCAKGVNSALSGQGQRACECCSTEHVSVIPSIEVGHTFQLGTDFTKPFRALQDSEYLSMNCFGLGLGRMIAAAIDCLSPDSSVIRLPSAIAPFKLAVIPPSVATRGYEAMTFAESLISQIANTPQLKDDLFIDDRLNYSIGKRIALASSLGVPHIIVIGSFTARSLSGQPQVEYLRVDRGVKDPVEVGKLSHSELFELINRL